MVRKNIVQKAISQNDDVNHTVFGVCNDNDVTISQGFNLGPISYAMNRRHFAIQAVVDRENDRNGTERLLGNIYTYYNMV